ncbi:hypothetical protein D4R87_03085 [bacterium]|nr:MAG: hypothetical protein D4R87_03085 [bacterium]
MQDLSKTIYISQDDEITSVLDKVLQSNASKVFLVVPVGSLILKSIINLRILKEESECGEMNLIIVTTDLIGLAFAKKVKLNYSETLFGISPSEEESEIISLQRPKISISLSKIHVIDIVKNKFVYWSCALFIAILLIFSTSFLPSATVFVLATPNTITEHIDFKVDVNLDGYLFAENKISGRIMKIEENFSKVISSTGEKNIEEYAIGQITLFNEWDSNNQTIIAGTQIQHESGKGFKIESTVIIPGFARAGGDDISGKITASIIATEPGPQFNVSAGKFHITALSRTDKYEKIYGVSDEAMKGGRVGKEIFIAKDDIEVANAFVKDQMGSMYENESDFKKGSDEIILENSISNSISQIELNAKQGDQQKEFSIKAVISKECILVNKSIIEDFVKEWLREHDMGVADVKFEENIIVLPTDVNMAKNEFTVEVTRESGGAVSLEEIKEMILGKGEIEAKQLMGGVGTVENCEVKLWPFWVSKIPEQPEKVNVFLDRNYYFSILN